MPTPFTNSNWKFPSLTLILLAATMAIYWPGLSGPFVLDDLPNLGPLWILSADKSAWADLLFNSNSGPLHRPVAIGSFILNVFVSGIDPWTFKLTNLFIHLVVGILIWRLARHLFQMSPLSGLAELLSIICAALWMVSPFLVSTVLYPVQRMAQLAAFFSLVTVFLYVKFRIKTVSSSDGNNFTYIFSITLCFLLGVLSKENALITPLLLLLTEVSFFRFHGNGATKRFLRVGFLVTFSVPILLLIGYTVIRWPNIIDYSLRDYSLSERLLTQSRVLWDYISSLTVPQSFRFGVFHDDFTVSKSLVNPITTLISVSSIVITLIASIYFLFHKKLRVAAYGVLFFFTSHLIESTVFPLEMYFEHRNYLPAFGIYFFVAYLIGLVAQHSKLTYRISLIFCTLVVFLFGFSTLQRTIIWSNLNDLIFFSYLAHPNSPRANTEMLQLSIENGDIAQSRKYLANLERLYHPNTTAPKLQFLQVYCYSNADDSQVILDEIRNSFVWGSRVYLSNAIDSLNQLQRSGGCDSIDWNSLTETYENAYNSHEFRIAFPHPLHSRSIRLRLAENFLFNDKKETSYIILKQLKAEEPMPAIDFLLLQASVATGRFEEANELLPSISAHFHALTETQQNTLRLIESLLNEMAR